MAANNDSGVFVPTTSSFDRSLIDQIDVNSDEFKDFLIRLYQTINEIALATNVKDTGVYKETEFINGQLWFSNKALSSLTSQAPSQRQVFRKVIDFGALHNAAGTKTIAHGITVTGAGIALDVTFTRIYATASNKVGFLYRPIPYASATANEIIELFVDQTNVNITVGKDQSAFTDCYVVLEYIKN